MGAVEAVAIDQATDWARSVAAGEIVAGPHVRRAAQRHLRDLEHGPGRGLLWLPEMAQRAIEFIELLRHYQGEAAGKPFLLSPHQKFIVGSLFGWYRADRLHRRFRTAYCEVAKGDGKTPLAAAIGLYGEVADGESGAEVYSAATGRDQAAICFNDALQMVRQSPELSRRLDPQTRSIYYPATSSVFRPVSAEGRGLDGKRPHMVLVDELHEHPSGLVLEKMRAGTKFRTRALIFCITNSGHDKDTVCGEYHDTSVAILNGTIENDAWFAFIASLDDSDDPFADEACWVKANPNLGVTIQPQYLREQVEEARSVPSKRGLVLRLNFCRWTQAETAWGDIEAWNRCAGPVDADALAGRRCHGGLDLASNSDFCATVLAFEPTDEDPLERLLARIYLPQAAAEKMRKQHFVPIDEWVRGGWITLTPGSIADYGAIEHDLDADIERFEVAGIRFDRWNSSDLVQRMSAKHGDKLMVSMGQGFASMNAPMKSFERAYLGTHLAHGGNPVLRWMFGNVVAEQSPAGDIKPVRPKKVHKKIDGIVAAIMAHAGVMSMLDRADSIDEALDNLIVVRR